ncbi:MAG: adenylate/guanylate cyclase domain-containing protein [Alphaproteobacteria bacterium]|nr:adenylate/guanylate cyclase domain-containing protein [Alphaproteobacteria bacterium]
MNTSAQSPLDRRLAAVAFADIAGFSRLVALDDVGTIRKWQALRRDVMEPQTREHGGRIVELAGDALLVEFPSVVHALSWAGDVQRATERTRVEHDPISLTLRIGINVDEVIVEDVTLQGDGVNIAARIHQAAEPGEIVCTGIVRELVGSRMPVSFHDRGTPRLKNIERVVHVYSVEWNESETSKALHHPYLEWSTRPTLAVMPFRSIGGSEQSDYFGQGITDDIITGLSRSRSLHVIARASMWRYADSQKDVRDVAAELGVGYVLDGTVNRRDGHLRINAELIHIAHNRPIWAERFDGEEKELFEFQDRIAASILGSLEPQVRAAEMDRVRDWPTSSLDAYDCVLKALSQLFLFTDESFRLSDQALRRALELDPSYAQAYAYSAWRLNFLLGEGRSQDPEVDTARAIAFAQKAIALDPQDVFALTVAGHITSFLQSRPEEGLELFETALALDENSAFAWATSGTTLSYLGNPDDAMKRFRNAWKLSPYDRMNFFWWGGAGIAEFVAGRYGESIAWSRMSKRANPRLGPTLRMLAAALALSGELEEARDVAAEFLRMDPEFRVSRFVERYPLRRPDDLNRYEEGLLAAGLPA